MFEWEEFSWGLRLPRGLSVRWDLPGLSLPGTAELDGNLENEMLRLEEETHLQQPVLGFSPECIHCRRPSISAGNSRPCASCLILMVVATSCLSARAHDIGPDTPWRGEDSTGSERDGQERQ